MLTAIARLVFPELSLHNGNNANNTGNNANNSVNVEQLGKYDIEELKQLWLTK